MKTNASRRQTYTDQQNSMHQVTST